MTAPDPAPRTLGGHAAWLAGDATAGIAFVGRGPEGDRVAVLDRVLGRRLDVAWARQVHGRHVLAAVAGCAGEADALTTSELGLALAISTADCVPLVLAAADRLVAVHAGWRGIAARIVEPALAALAAPPDAVSAWIGPAIGACCYEVGPDVAAAVVAAAGPECRSAAAPGRQPRLDLAAAVASQLRTAGVERVATIRACTRCLPQLHSYRRDGQAAGRNLAFAWRRDAP
jgi:purine-nucleoside/S-methyl-5'-thioadenosine phosphorylase / adenosine deaminase